MKGGRRIRLEDRQIRYRWSCHTKPATDSEPTTSGSWRNAYELKT